MVKKQGFPQSNMKLPYPPPPPPSARPFHFKVPRREIPAGFSASSKVGRKIPAPRFPETMSTITIARFDNHKTFNSQPSYSIGETSAGDSVAQER